MLINEKLFCIDYNVCGQFLNYKLLDLTVIINEDNLKICQTNIMENCI